MQPAEHLEAIEVKDELQDKPFRMPVQWVNRPNLDFRGFSGFISSGVNGGLRAMVRNQWSSSSSVRPSESSSGPDGPR